MLFGNSICHVCCIIKLLCMNQRSYLALYQVIWLRKYDVSTVIWHIFKHNYMYFILFTISIVNWVHPTLKTCIRGHRKFILTCLIGTFVFYVFFLNLGFQESWTQQALFKVHVHVQFGREMVYKWQNCELNWLLVIMYW